MKIHKSLSWLIVAFSFSIGFLSLSRLESREKKIGIYPLEVVAPENQDYLRKVLEQGLYATLQEKTALQWISIRSSSLTSSNLLKKQGLDALVQTTLLQVGSRFEVRTKIIFSSSEQFVSESAQTLDALLPALKKHAEQIAKLLDASSSVSKPLEARTAFSPTPLPSAPPPIGKAKPEPRQESSTPSPAGSAGMPDYRWMSERLPFEGRGMAYADLDGDGSPEILLIDLNNLHIYQWSQNRLSLIRSYRAGSGHHFIHVSVLDLDGDGRPEIVLSDILNGQAASLALKYDRGEFQTVFKDAPWIVKEIEWEGKKILVGEQFSGREINFHKIKKLKWIGNQLKEEGELPIPKEIGIYGLNTLPWENQGEGIVFLTPSGSIKLYEKQNSAIKRVGGSSDQYGGSPNFIRLEQRSILNQVESDLTFFNLDPIGWLGKDGKPRVLVAKNEDFLKGVIGTRPLYKNSSLTLLRWEEAGLRELVSTRKIEGFIADYERVLLPDENSPKILVLMNLRDRGFLNSMGKFQSVLAIYDLE